MASPAAAWLANDEDGDGTVSGAEMIGAFDKDHDGKLDAAELEDISRAYAGQIDYSNTLLNQIADMEHAGKKVWQPIRSHVTTDELAEDVLAGLDTALKSATLFYEGIKKLGNELDAAGATIPNAA